MGGFFAFLRWLIQTAVTATVALFLTRYLFDLFPTTAPALEGIRTWVGSLTQPAMSVAGPLLKIPHQKGMWNLLPLALAVAALFAGALLVNALDAVSRPLLRPRAPRAPKPAPAAPGPVAGPATMPPGMAAPPAAAPIDPGATRLIPAAAPNQGTATTFNPRPAAPAQNFRMPNIGRYEILEELGRGAMGAVYKARDPQIGRIVAIKTVLGGGMGGDPAAEEFKKRFFAEARAAGRLNHPGIMKVHDLIEDLSGRPCLVLEYFEGKTLDQLVADKHPSLAECLKIMTQAASALGFAHDHGVVHRDIKPGNIMISATGHTVISDFGIAKIEDTHMTATGTILGTPAFMSPEQVQGLPVDHRSDIFSLGTVLYWLVTGERPFGGSTFTSIAYNVVHTSPRSVTEGAAPPVPDLEPVLARCLAKAPEDRYASAHELAVALRAVRIPDNGPVAPG